MCRPCDTGYCVPDQCSDYDACLDEALREPAVAYRSLEDIWNSCPDHGINEVCTCIKQGRKVFVR